MPAYADYFNSKVYRSRLSTLFLRTWLTPNTQVNNFRRINHDSDPVPIIPGRGLGFSHVAGEIHIMAADHWKSCSGNDNTESGCTIDQVPNVLAGNVMDHMGPYQGVWIGTSYCK